MHDEFVKSLVPGNSAAGLFGMVKRDLQLGDKNCHIESPRVFCAVRSSG